MSRPPLPPFKGYRDAFEQLESVIDRAVRFARLQRTLAETHDEPGTADFKATMVEAMSFVADETFKAVDEVEDLWLHFHNSAPDTISGEVQP